MTKRKIKDLIAPKWAQRAAMLIYRDMESGAPTKKGIKTIVRGLWAAIIAREAKR
jgi:hypothetical protein